jgi:hypothetical protein
MSKLPFFKFDPAEWLIGRISFQPLDIQGAFIQSCCMYWRLGGKMKDSDIDYRINKDYIQKLKDLGFLKHEGENIHVAFLDNQIDDYAETVGERKTQKSEAGKIGAEKRWNKKNTDSTIIAENSTPIADDSTRHNTNSTKIADDSTPCQEEEEEDIDKEIDVDSYKRNTKGNIFFQAPTLEDVFSYCNEAEIPPDVGEKMFRFYAAANWIDSKGKKVFSWKQKLETWFQNEKSKVPTGGGGKYDDLIAQTQRMINNHGNRDY